ncbi:MAG: helix-hairpin-helix domain-containing protein [Candidatus Omnitrophica bacterium]|nr:helix-hairpin-helix domain-containing protein [Candidatus Omnitrophota bacterium]
MQAIKKDLQITEKLSILSQDSQYDLACACATQENEHRKRSKEDKWVYPVTLPTGGTTFLFKTLLSNECVNNCKYCPLRIAGTPQRCRLEPQELVKTFLSYYHSGKISGLFLSSGVMGTPDNTMEHINRVALLLRRAQFKGYVHLKVIPGASDGAIRQSIALANAVSLNIETAGEENFKALSTSKNYQKDILRPIELISKLTHDDYRYKRVHQTTQFVVGAAQETDKQIIDYSWNLYKKLKLSRIYFSAYQRGLGEPDLAAEFSDKSNADILTREHRLYQADWLMRKYGFRAEEIPLNSEGNLSLDTDPKEMWARLNPDFFPVNINKDEKNRLLRVPGIGQIMAERILECRNQGLKIRSLDDIRKPNKILEKARDYIVF